VSDKKKARIPPATAPDESILDLIAERDAWRQEAEFRLANEKEANALASRLAEALREAAETLDTEGLEEAATRYRSLLAAFDAARGDGAGK
jgi:aspartate aminotransferase-like enzyme